MRPIHGSNRFGLTVGPRRDPLAARGHFEQAVQLAPDTVGGSVEPSV